MDGIPVTLIVKAPNQQIEDQTIKCEISWTIKKLKGYLSEVYPSKPSTEEQKLIYSGQLLPDTVVLKDILRQYEGQETHTLHLVCTPKKEAYKRNVNSIPSQNQRNMQTLNDIPSAVQNATNQQIYSTEPGDLRLRHNNASTSTTTIPNAAAATNATPDDRSAMWNNFLPSESHLNSQIAAQQMLWLNNAYLEYLTQYQQLVEMGIRPENAYMRALQTHGSNYEQGFQLPAVGQTNQPINVQAVPPPEANNAAAAVVQNPVGGVAVQDEAEGERDWLDWFYFMSRILVLFSIVYFYSSPLRFLIVLFLGLWVYLYQIGFFRNQPAEIINNNEIAENNENNNVIPQENVPQENPAPAPSNDVPETNTQNVVPEPERPRPTVLALAWTFITTFFASLIPETPNAI